MDRPPRGRPSGRGTGRRREDGWNSSGTSDYGRANQNNWRASPGSGSNMHRGNRNRGGSKRSNPHSDYKRYRNDSLLEYLQLQQIQVTREDVDSFFTALGDGSRGSIDPNLKARYDIWKDENKEAIDLVKYGGLAALRPRGSPYGSPRAGSMSSHNSPAGHSQYSDNFVPEGAYATTSPSQAASTPWDQIFPDLKEGSRKDHLDQSDTHSNASYEIPGNDRKCYVCDQTGHMQRDCPNNAGAGEDRKCYICGQTGHMQRDCPNGTGTPYQPVPGQVRILKRDVEHSPSPAYSSSPTQSSSIQDARSPAKEKAPAKELDFDNVVWNEDKYSLGTFFYNKVYMDAEKTVVWQPPDVSSSWIEVLGWPELVPTEGLRRVLIVHPGKWMEIQQYLKTIPNDVNLAVVCHKAEHSKITKSRKKQYSSEPMLWLCAVHDNCPGCEQRRQLQLIHPPESQTIRATVLLLRYTHFVRIVVISASIEPVLWERAAQLNWYNDFPIKDYLPDENGLNPPEEESLFKRDYNPLEDNGPLCRDLCLWMEKINPVAKARTYDIVRDADFSGLSKSISLVAGFNGTARVQYSPSSLQVGLGRIKTHSYLPDDMIYPACGTDMTVVTHGLHFHSEGCKPINDMFQLQQNDRPGKEKYHENIKFVYPTSGQTESAMQSMEDSSKARINALIYSNKDDPIYENRLWKFDKSIPLHMGNIYMKCTESPENKLLGWFMTGSQRLGPDVLGKQNISGDRTFQHYDLAVLCAPYKEESGKLCCVNLQRLVLPNFTLEMYGQDDTPYKSSNGPDFSADNDTVDADEGPVYMAEVANLGPDKKGGNRAFLEMPPKNHPSYQKFPALPSATRQKSSSGKTSNIYMHEDKWGTNMGHFRKCIVEFTVTLNNDMYRVSTVKNAHDDWESVYGLYGIKAPPAPVLCMGEIYSIMRKIIFLEEPDEEHGVYRKFAHFPESDKTGRILEGPWKMHMGRVPARCGQVVECYMSADRIVTKVKAVHQNWEKAFKANGIKDEDEPVELDAEAVYEKLGIVTDEDFDRYWDMKHQAAAEKMLQKSRIFKNYNVDYDPTAPSIEPWTMKTDDWKWLEKQTFNRCKGKFPELTGPYSLENIEKTYKGQRQLMFPGFPFRDLSGSS